MIQNSSIIRIRNIRALFILGYFYVSSDVLTNAIFLYQSWRKLRYSEPHRHRIVLLSFEWGFVRDHSPGLACVKEQVDEPARVTLAGRAQKRHFRRREHIFFFFPLEDVYKLRWLTNRVTLRWLSREPAVRRRCNCLFKVEPTCSRLFRLRSRLF